ncbi:MAG: hypothetical protein JWO60_438 [Frankiales bacterium]|nr:hypothetical protein [Frankiales bacterium]
MYARSTTFTDKPAAVEPAITLVRDEIMPVLLAMPGCTGLSMLVDRSSGGCVVTTAWDSEQAVLASEASVAPLRERAERLFGGRPEVRVWEIAVVHRARHVVPGACARLTWTRCDPSQVQELTDVFRHRALPRIEELPGFCSTSLLVDRVRGTSALATTYESLDALERSAPAAASLRERTLGHLQAELLDVVVMEVALAHLRVPETV